MTQPKLSVIIPFRKRDGDSDCIRRLNDAIQCFSGQMSIEVVVYDTGKKSLLDQEARLANQNNLRYFHYPESGVFAPGKVRNRAIVLAKGQFIFLFDADLLISHYLIKLLDESMQQIEREGVQGFRMFPCLYLSKAYTSFFAAQSKRESLQSGLYASVLESYLRGDLEKVDGIALASSCLLVRRDWFLALGGFRDCFAGHGCEDFDLIHRLAAFCPVGKKPSDYEVDIKQQFPADYQGFRRYFSYYAVPHLFERQFLLHQWHPRPLTKQYHRKRKVNETLFSDILKQPILDLPLPLPEAGFDDGFKKAMERLPFDSDNMLPYFQGWLRELQAQQGFPVEQYPGLFHWAEGVKKPSGGFRRKLRKLYMNPIQFFKDIN